MVMQPELHPSCSAASMLLTDDDKPMNQSAERHLAFGSAGGVFTSAQWCCLLSTQLHSKNPCFLCCVPICAGVVPKERVRKSSDRSLQRAELD